MVATDTAVPRSGSARIETDHPAHDDGDGQQRIANVVDAVHPSFEERRREDDDGDLRELGGLDAERSDEQPASRAFHGAAEEHGDEGKGGDAERHPNHHRLPIRAVVDAHHDGHQEQTHQRPRQLLEQEEVRHVAALHRGHC